MRRKILKFLRNKPVITRILSKIYSLFSVKIKIKGKHNKLDIYSGFFRKLNIHISGNNNSVIIKSFSRLYNCRIYIYGSNNQLVLEEGTYSQNSEFYFEDTSNEIKVGKKTNILGAHIAVTEHNHFIHIGEQCLISSNVEIRNGDSHSIYDLNNKRINFAKNITIEDRVWIGANARLLKGVFISQDSIIANSAIVTREFYQQNVIIGGFPAQIIKKDIKWGNERTYE